MKLKELLGVLNGDIHIHLRDSRGFHIDDGEVFSRDLYPGNNTFCEQEILHVEVKDKDDLDVYITGDYHIKEYPHKHDSDNEITPLPHFKNAQELKRFLYHHRDEYVYSQLYTFQYNDGDKVLTTDIYTKKDRFHPVARVEFDPITFEAVNNHNQVFFKDNDYSVTENGGNFSIVNKQNKTVYQTKDKNKVTKNLQNLNSNKPIEDAKHNYPNKVVWDVQDYILYNKYNVDDMKEAKEKLTDIKFSEMLKDFEHIYGEDPAIILHKYLEWNGIFGFDDSIISHYQNGDLRRYLNEEGIYGYTDEIESILKEI